MLSPAEYCWAMRELGVYSDAEWPEFISYWSISPAEGEAASNSLEAKEFLRRVRSNEHFNGRANAATDFCELREVSAKILRAAEVRSRAGTRKIGALSGCFDLLHLSHLRSLYAEKQLLNQSGDCAAVVLVLGDKEIEKKKGRGRPVQSLAQRVALLAGLSFVDFVVPLQGADCRPELREMKVDFFIKNRRDEQQPIVLEEAETVTALGGIVLWVDDRADVKKFSTTDIVKLLSGETRGGAYGG